MFYFAYGSNLSAAQMRSRCPTATSAGRATLAGWRFLVNERGVATLAPSAPDVVHGGLWTLAAGDLEILDRFEGTHDGRYGRELLEVRRPDGSTIDAFVYLDHRLTTGPPRPGYLERVVEGAREFGLPASYVADLEQHRAPEPGAS